MRTRLWLGHHTSTAVQFRNDVEEDDPMVWMHTNLGWIPVGNSVGLTEQEAEKLAVGIAGGYNLEEQDEETALAYA